MIDSRPLRFVVVVLALWAGTRAMLLWPDGEYRGPSHDALRLTHEYQSAMAPAVAADAPMAPAHGRAAGFARPLPASYTPFRIPAVEPVFDRDALLAQAQGGAPLLSLLSLSGVQSGLASAAVLSDPRLPPPPRPRRLSGYGWIFVRNGGATPGLADGGQLGGSQAGLRLDYAVAQGLALSGRISAPLDIRAGREAAIGLNWRPSRNVPLNLSLERRIALDKGGRNAFAVMAAGGISSVALPVGFTLEAYGQAGIVGLKRRDGFVDGAVTATRPVVKDDDVSLAAGGGVWGAAQPGVERLDIGPRVRFRLDRLGANIGASLDWRQRIAGNAAPQSGLALTLDGSF